MIQSFAAFTYSKPHPPLPPGAGALRRDARHVHFEACLRSRSLVDFVHVWVHAETTYAYQGRANVLATM
jgi:hypothetical protein